MPYRQLEGFTRILHRLIPALPPGDYSGLRKRILRLDLSPYLGMAPAYPSAIEEAIPRARHVVAQFKGTPVSH